MSHTLMQCRDCGFHAGCTCQLGSMEPKQCSVTGKFHDLVPCADQSVTREEQERRNLEFKRDEELRLRGAFWKEVKEKGWSSLDCTEVLLRYLVEHEGWLEDPDFERWITRQEAPPLREMAPIYTMPLKEQDND